MTNSFRHSHCINVHSIVWLTWNVKNLNKCCSLFQHVDCGLCDVCCCCEYFLSFFFLDYAEDELKSNELCITGINASIAWHFCGKIVCFIPLPFVMLNTSPEVLNKCLRMPPTQWCSYLSTVSGQITVLFVAFD